ncbi:MAG: type VI secretion system baseplate subunit TssK, partial [Pseudomonadota bacterium]
MSWDSKVLWTEGLFLQPHHFQQADRYTEALVAGLARRVTPYAWGVSALEIDDEVLKVGQIVTVEVDEASEYDLGHALKPAYPKGHIQRPHPPPRSQSAR